MGIHRIRRIQRKRRKTRQQIMVIVIPCVSMLLMVYIVIYRTCMPWRKLRSPSLRCRELSNSWQCLLENQTGRSFNCFMGKLLPLVLPPVSLLKISTMVMDEDKQEELSVNFARFRGVLHKDIVQISCDFHKINHDSQLRIFSKRNLSTGKESWVGN